MYDACATFAGKRATGGVGDPTVVTAWQRGLIIFHDVPLAAVVEEINRYRPGRIILFNDALAERKVVAGFRLDQIDDVVNCIAQALRAKIRSLSGGSAAELTGSAFMGRRFPLLASLRRIARA